MLSSLRCVIFAALFLVVLAMPLSGKESVVAKRYDQLEFQRLAAMDQLTSQQVTSIAQDSRGFVWVGTRSGLNRFDGYTFESIGSEPSAEGGLIGSYVETILPDKSGSIWVGTTRGVSRYDYETGLFTNYLSDIEGTHISSILSRENGQLLVVTRYHVFRYVNERDEFERVDIDTIGSLRVVFEDSSGFLWLGEEEGLYRYDKDWGSRSQYELPVSEGESARSAITALAEDSEGYIWCGTNRNGVYIINPATGETSKMDRSVEQEDVVGSIMIDNQDIALIGTVAGVRVKAGRDDFGKLYRYSDFELDSVQSGLVSSLLLDDQGSLWVGALNDGISYVPAYKDFFSYSRSIGDEDSLTKEKVTSLHKDSKDRLWIGYRNDGLDMLDLSTGSKTHFDPFDGKQGGLRRGAILQVQEDSEGSIWIASHWNGLQKMDPTTGLITVIQPGVESSSSIGGRDVRRILFDEKENLWIGLDTIGLDYFNRQTGRFDHYGLRAGRWIPRRDNKHYARVWVYDMIFDSRGDLWIGSSAGLSRKVRGRGEFVSYIDSVIRNTRVTCLFEDSRGCIWVGSKAGLYCWSRDTDDFIRIGDVGDLASETVRSIIEDDAGRMWIGTAKGLSVYDPINESFTNYGKLDGLLSNEFMERAVLRDSDGELYFGTTKGVNHFNPASIVGTAERPRVYITEFNLSNEAQLVSLAADSVLTQPMIVTPSLTLPAGNRSFGFDFVALDYVGTSKNRYAYRLDGFDESWVDSESSREAVYTNIDPGEYVFRVKGRNGDGVWSDPASVRVVILPWFWQTDWFVVLCVVVLALVLITFYRLRVAMMKARQKSLAKKVEERTQDLEEALSELNDHRENLEVRIESRTSELTKAKEKAEESERLKTAFLENVSHEIRTPMNAIMGFLDILDKVDVSDEDRSNYTSIVQNNGQSLLLLIDDILDISRLEAGVIRINSALCNIDELLENLYYQFKEELNQGNGKGIQIEVVRSLSMNSLYMLTDVGRLRQILSNLIENAIKFTDEGSIRIGYSIREDKRLGSCVEMFVEDTGIGISDVDLERIFNRFGKAESHSERMSRGTGLGLAIVSKLVALMDGRIDVTSELNEGARFVVTVPYHVTSDIEKLPPSTAVEFA